MGGIYLGNALLTHSTVENIIQDNDFYIKADGNHIDWVNEEIYTLNISEPTNFTLNDMLVAKEEQRDIILQINNLDTNGIKTTNYLMLESFDANSLINQFTNDNFIASINNNSTITIRQNVKMTSVIETNKGLEQKFWRGTKEEYKALDVKDEDTMYIVIDEEGGSIKADWNQNDESAPDYVKNRTHWVEPGGWTLANDIYFHGETYTFMVDENGFSSAIYIDNEDGGTILGADGEYEGCTFKVTWNGTEYEVKHGAVSENARPQLGYDRDDLPFVIDAPWSTIIYLNTETVNYDPGTYDVTIKIEVLKPDVYHKLDAGFMPATVATKADIEAAIGAAIGGSY